jgi:hypothetical protein
MRSFAARVLLLTLLASLSPAIVLGSALLLLFAACAWLAGARELAGMPVHWINAARAGLRISRIESKAHG